MLYYRTRYYETSQGRFVNRDRIAAANRYAYITNWAVTSKDPLGLNPCYEKEWTRIGGVMAKRFKLCDSMRGWRVFATYLKNACGGAQTQAFSWIEARCVRNAPAKFQPFTGGYFGKKPYYPMPPTPPLGHAFVEEMVKGWAEVQVRAIGIGIGIPAVVVGTAVAPEYTIPILLAGAAAGCDSGGGGAPGGGGTAPAPGFSRAVSACRAGSTSCAASCASTHKALCRTVTSITRAITSGKSVGASQRRLLCTSLGAGFKQYMDCCPGSELTSTQAAVIVQECKRRVP